MFPSIVITGASGFIGRQLIPLLVDNGADVLVCGRDAQKLTVLYPDLPNCTYDDLDQAASGYDLLVHLAAINSDQRASWEAFQQANVALAKDVLDAAARAGVQKMVFASSFHALDQASGGHYAASKRAAEANLRGQASKGSLLIAYMPNVYGQEFAGRFAALNSMPKSFRPLLFSVLSAVWPTLSVERLAAFLVEDAPETTHDSVILSDGQDKNRFYKAVRLSLDYVFAFVVIAGLSWLLLAVWLAVRLTSAGPGLIKQDRVGRGRALFRCWKFRTMLLGTKVVPTHEASSTALTPIGAFLRKTKIDELPQAVNILRGEMTLIGPRPCLPTQQELIEERSSRGVFALKPGITGLSQVRGIDMRDPGLLAINDETYRFRQSLALDLQIIAATVAGKRLWPFA